MDEDPGMTIAQDDARALAARLAALKARLGDAYWENTEVAAQQDSLTGMIKALREAGGPQATLRQLARLEADVAPLIWPGRG